jgi:hypothetical protein
MGAPHIGAPQYPRDDALSLDDAIFRNFGKSHVQRLVNERREPLTRLQTRIDLDQPVISKGLPGGTLTSKFAFLENQFSRHDHLFSRTLR